MQDRPKCAINGAFNTSAGMGMCGHVIVGREFCGYSGECEHQVKEENPETKTDEKE